MPATDIAHIVLHVHAQPNQQAMRIILPPPQWDKTNDGPDSAALARWMAAYELSLLPSATVFPRPGQIWETIRSCDVSFKACIEWQGSHFHKLQLPGGGESIMHGSAKIVSRFPFGTARIEKGERVRVLEWEGLNGFADPKPLWVNLQPQRYEELEETIVPREFRETPGYMGYRLHVKTARPRWCLHPEGAYLNSDFRHVGNVT